MIKRHKILGSIVAFSLAASALPLGASLLTTPSDSSFWLAVPNIGLDPVADLQTGQHDADLVGIISDPGFFTGWDGTSLYFRIRQGSASHTGPTYSGLTWIGIDANLDGALDLFIGINNQGSNSSITFNKPGSDANTSPKTTSIVTAAAPYVISESTSNFDYEFVNSTIDPMGSSAPGYDLNSPADGTDVYLTILVPFFGPSGTATLQGALAGIASLTVDEKTALRYILATSTQQNSLNQDIGGTSAGGSSTSTYTQLGAFSPTITATGVVVPEPSTVLMLISGFGLCLAGTRFRRSKS